MKSIFASITLLLVISINSSAQNIDSVNHSFPYNVKLKVDVPVTLAAIGLTVYGNHLIHNKSGLTMEQLATKTPDKVNGFDRGSAGFYSAKADKDSYIPFDISFGLPVIMVLTNGPERSEMGKILLLYTETMAITGTFYTMSAGNIVRSRPLVYSTNAPLDVRLSKNSQRSFFAGHTAATAAATFFTAKVFSDYNPDSRLKPFVWGVAAAVPALVGYLRYKSGEHFLSDNIVGYAVGTACGILVPKFHKSRFSKNVTFIPSIGTKSNSFSFLYSIK